MFVTACNWYESSKHCSHGVVVIWNLAELGNFTPLTHMALKHTGLADSRLAYQCQQVSQLLHGIQYMH